MSGTGISRVSNCGLGHHIFWIIISALSLAYSATHLALNYHDSGVAERLIDLILVFAWAAWLAQAIALVAQGRYRKPVPPVSLVKKATAEDVR